MIIIYHYYLLSLFIIITLFLISISKKPNALHSTYSTRHRDLMEVYREKALKLFDTLLDDVRRNLAYSIFVYNGPKQRT